MDGRRGSHCRSQNMNGHRGRGRYPMPTMNFPSIIVSPLTFNCRNYIGSPNRRVPRRRRSGYPLDEIPDIPPALAALILQQVPVPLQVVEGSSSCQSPLTVPEVVQEPETSGVRPRPDEYLFGLSTPFDESDTEKSVLKKKKVTRKIKKCEIVAGETIIPVMVEGEVPLEGVPEGGEVGSDVVPDVSEPVVPDVIEEEVPEDVRNVVYEVRKDVVPEVVPEMHEIIVPEDVEEVVPEVVRSIVLEVLEEAVDEEVRSIDPEILETVGNEIPEGPDVEVPCRPKLKKKIMTPCRDDLLDEMIMSDAVEIASTLESSEFRRLSAKKDKGKCKDKGKGKVNDVIIVSDSPVTRSRSKGMAEKRPFYSRKFEIIRSHFQLKKAKTVSDNKITQFYHSACLIQHRCRIATYMTTMKDVVFEESVSERILGTPFGHFFRVQPMVVNNFQLDDLCGRFIGNYTFQLKKKEVRVTVEDVGKILSIPYKGTPIDLNRASNDTELWRKFSEKSRRTNGRRATAISWYIYYNVKPNPRADHVYQKWQGVQDNRQQIIQSLKSRLVESHYRNDLILYVRVVKVEESQDKLSGLTGFMSPVRRSEEYNIERHIKRPWKSVESSPVEMRYVVPIERSPVLTTSNSRVPKNEAAVVPKLESSLSVVDLITPEDGKTRVDVIHVLSPIESNETHLKMKKIEVKRVGRKLSYDHLVESPVSRMTGEEFVNIMSGYFEGSSSRLTCSPPEKNSPADDRMKNLNGPVSEDTLFEDQQVHLRFNASLKPPWSYPKCCPFTPKPRTTPKHLRKCITDIWKVDDFGVLQIWTSKTTVVPLDGSPKTPEVVGKVLEYSPKFWDS
ncbi:hypothetical protein ZOSMA_45G00200 [Zostera marina]|uniref:Uncharacterized protein n=1 Tax=Zostera marina TaxID=29655 RepID=A0A0K9P088_ZOSMR|nr:hypothetical protein ZOSMA_45G00200 [Zostera marina]